MMGTKKYARLLAVLGITLLLLVTLGLVATGQGLLQRITYGSGTDRDSQSPAVSYDGRWLAFHSDSDFLDGGVADNQNEIWLVDTTGYTLTQITNYSSNRDSRYPAISSDGLTVTLAFVSDADLLQQGNMSQYMTELWLYHSQEMTFTRATTRPTGQLSILKTINNLSISQDGAKIAFQSNIHFFADEFIDPQEIWLYDTQLMTLTKVTSSTTFAPDLRDSQYPSLSGNGQVVAFHSDSDFNAEGNIVDQQDEIWLYDVGTQVYTRVTTASTTGRRSQYPSLDHNGELVVFQSDSDLLGQGLSEGQTEIWLYDTATMTVTRVTTSTSSESNYPKISPDGETITFVSDTDFLDEAIGPTLSARELWQYTISTTQLVRLTDGGVSQIKSKDDIPVVNQDGSVVAFAGKTDFYTGQSLDRLEIWRIAPPTDFGYLPALLKD